MLRRFIYEEFNKRLCLWEYRKPKKGEWYWDGVKIVRNPDFDSIDLCYTLVFEESCIKSFFRRLKNLGKRAKSC